MYIAALSPWIFILLHIAVTDQRWEIRRSARIACVCAVLIGVGLEL